MAPLPPSLHSILNFSSYVQRLLHNGPISTEDDLAKHLGERISRQYMQDALAILPTEKNAFFELLRNLRQKVMLHVLIRDLLDHADLNEVCQTMTDLAETTVHASQLYYAQELAEQFGQPIGQESHLPQTLIVIAMGKLGGRELNVSSDIDLVFAYPEEGETTGPRTISNREFFEKLGRKLIASLNDITAHGFVFRVDMRLRPFGDSGPLTTSFNGLENYLLNHGRAWERYAWLKARPITGDPADQENLLRLIKPFVYRKYLDYDALDALRNLHIQLQQEVIRKDYRYNIKLGPGGIREIEFIAQLFQLIRGGREIILQERSTRDALQKLGDRKILPSTTATELLQAYTFLRRLEHRLQYRDDQQTQEFPRQESEQQALAATMGYASAAELLAAWHHHQKHVTKHFNAAVRPLTIQLASPTNPSTATSSTSSAASSSHFEWTRLNAEQLHTWLTKEGLTQPQSSHLNESPIFHRLQTLRQSNRYLHLPTLSKQRLDSLIPLVIGAAKDTPTPVSTAGRLLDLLEAIARRSAYLALFHEHPALIPKIAGFVGASPWAARYLTQHPILLDELIDERLLHREPNWQEWENELQQELALHHQDIEQQMDTLRYWQQAQILHLLAQDLAGDLSVERLADHLSALADKIVNAVLTTCWQNLPSRHLSAPHFAVIAYGKLGSKELGYASDLDLVFLFDHHSDHDEQAPQIYTRLAQRMLTWLTSTTAAGTLYPVDTRLRPNGEAGLLVNSLEAFRLYQTEHAWLWEHQALTRARFCAGDSSIKKNFDAIRLDILATPRTQDKVAQEIIKTRQKIQAAHPYAQKHFDVKYSSGGMIDLEFLVQYLILIYSAQHPEFTNNTGNLALLKHAAELQLIPTNLADEVIHSYRELRRLQHRQRLDDLEQPLSTFVSDTQITALQNPIQQLWQYLLPTL